MFGVVVFPFMLEPLALSTNLLGSYYTFRVLVGKSMLPAIRTGDYVLLRRGAEDIKVGDIICFRQDATGATILHRVIEIEENQGLIFRTKGDGNDFIDDLETRTKDILGKAVLIIPISSIMNPLLFLPALGLSASLLSKQLLDCHRQKITTVPFLKSIRRDMTLVLILLITILSINGLVCSILLINT